MSSDVPTPVHQTPEFLSWLKGCQELINERFKKEYPILSPNLLTCEPGKNYIRVVSVSDNGKGSRSVFCFVASEDNETKALGTVKRGDVLKSASWKAPAKGARGNIFEPDNGLGRMTHYGATYNK